VYYNTTETYVLFAFWFLDFRVQWIGSDCDGGEELLRHRQRSKARSSAPDNRHRFPKDLPDSRSPISRPLRPRHRRSDSV